MQLDQLLSDPVTTEVLAEILTREEWQRPAEGLCFEYKREYRSGMVSKAVAAFANNEGGFLFLGAETRNGTPVSYPGLDTDIEWPLRVSNEIQGNVSPLPAWRVAVVLSPQDSKRVVVVVRVPQSSRAPHLVGGRIYVRSPGGASDPITDRATLDRLYGRQDTVDAMQTSRLHPNPMGMPRDTIGGLFRESETPWQFSVVALPVPNDVPFQDLFTRATYDLLPTVFKGPALADGRSAEMDEESVTVRFPHASVRVFEDGLMHLLVRPPTVQPPREAGAIRPEWLFPYAAELLAAQAARGVHEVQLSIQLADSGGFMLATGGPLNEPDLAPDAQIPDPWNWDGEVLTEATAAAHALRTVKTRFWRAAGIRLFDS